MSYKINLLNRWDCHIIENIVPSFFSNNILVEEVSHVKNEALQNLKTSTVEILIYRYGTMIVRPYEK